MGIHERKVREREERRTLILETAKNLIHEKGVGACSMQDIADSAEVSKATLYLYFKNKEELIDDLVSNARQDFVNYINSRIDTDMTGIETLRALWMCYIDIFGESSDIFISIGIKNQLDMDFEKAPEAADDKGISQLFMVIEKIIQKGVNDGTLLPSINPHKITKILILIASSVIQSVANLPEEMRNSKVIVSEMRVVFEIILRGLASDTVDKSLLSLS